MDTFGIVVHLKKTIVMYIVLLYMTYSIQPEVKLVLGLSLHCQANRIAGREGATMERGSCCRWNELILLLQNVMQLK